MGYCIMEQESCFKRMAMKNPSWYWIIMMERRLLKLTTGITRETTDWLCSAGVPALPFSKPGEFKDTSESSDITCTKG